MLSRAFLHLPFIHALCRETRVDLLLENPKAALKSKYLLWHVAPWGKETVPINQSGSYLRPSGSLLYLINKFQDEVGLWGWLRLVGPEGDRTYGCSSWMGDQVSLPYVILWANPSLQAVSPKITILTLYL